ncbi:MAG: flagellar biosynthesis anti-sigma factor FlgM [Acidobacteriaceae bacterium]
MEIRDRSTYTSNLESPGIEGAARLRTDNASTFSVTQTPSRTDSSELSPVAHAMSQAMQMPDIRHDRIASLQQQIAADDYHVAAKDVADAMLRNFAG